MLRDNKGERISMHIEYLFHMHLRAWNVFPKIVCSINYKFNLLLIIRQQRCVYFLHIVLLHILIQMVYVFRFDRNVQWYWFIHQCTTLNKFHLTFSISLDVRPVGWFGSIQSIKYILWGLSFVVQFTKGVFSWQYFIHNKRKHYVRVNKYKKKNILNIPGLFLH